MAPLIDWLTSGLIALFLVVGLVGTVVPILPGTLLIWLAILFYALANGFGAIGVGAFVAISLIALVTGTADIWLTLIGAKKGGASRRALLYGVIGALIGTVLLPLLGTIIGYAAGVLFGEYQRQGDWDLAVKASVGGLAGWGVAAAVQFAGGVAMIMIFLWQVVAVG